MYGKASMIHQNHPTNASQCSSCHQIQYKFGVKIPHTYTKAVKFDTENGNTLWQDATTLELSQICNFNCFNDLGPNATLPPDNHQISVQFVYDVNEDGHCKGHLMAHGDFTPEPEEAVYARIASLCSLQFVTFLSELNVRSVQNPLSLFNHLSVAMHSCKRFLSLLLFLSFSILQILNYKFPH